MIADDRLTAAIGNTRSLDNACIVTFVVKSRTREGSFGRRDRSGDPKWLSCVGGTSDELVPLELGPLRNVEVLPTPKKQYALMQKNRACCL